MEPGRKFPPCRPRPRDAAISLSDRESMGSGGKTARKYSTVDGRKRGENRHFDYPPTENALAAIPANPGYEANFTLKQRSSGGAGERPSERGGAGARVSTASFLYRKARKRRDRDIRGHLEITKGEGVQERARREKGGHHRERGTMSVRNRADARATPKDVQTLFLYIRRWGTRN